MLTSALVAQTVETIPFRALLSPANEVPALTLQASGTSTVLVHVMRDASGQVISGSVDFNTRFTFPGASTFTGMHIHRGAAGVNGPVVINSGLSGRVEDTTGRAGLFYQGQVRPSDTDALAALRDLLANPAGYYVNVHTTDNPGGAIRGQLQRAELAVVMGQMNPFNENPPISGLNATAVGAVVFITTRAANGALTSAEATFDVTYTGFPERTFFTGLHIHTGGRTVNGPVVINSGLTGQVAASETGAGNLRYTAEVAMNNPAAVAAVAGALYDPRDYYINLHTTVNPGGAVRSQLRVPEETSFQVAMSPANEVPPIAGLDASARAKFTLYSLRNNEGWISSGLAIFDVNHRFPGEVQFTGLHIHAGAAGTNGGVVIDSGLTRAATPLSADGFGNLYRWAAYEGQRMVEAMNGVSLYPESHYINLHSAVNAGGAVRAQLAAPWNAAPTVVNAISAVSDPTQRTVAPLGLITIFGRDLLPTTATYSSFDTQAPLQLNGTSVTIGGLAAALVTLGRESGLNPPDYILAQVPGGLAAGNHPLVVRTRNGASAPQQVPVASIAPALFFDSAGAIAFHLEPDTTLVRADSPARPGEVIAFLATGLGPTRPALRTGEVPFDEAPLVAANISASVGGRPAIVVGAQMVPETVGLYVVGVLIPLDANGSLPVTIGVAGQPAVQSNAVVLPVRR
jgi:uncharacterized protein (TIGR03437 family)